MEKPKKYRSLTRKPKLPQIRNFKTPSEKSFQASRFSFLKSDMMTKEHNQSALTGTEKPPAVNPEMDSKFLNFRPLLASKRPPPPPNKGYFFKFLNNEVKLIKWTFEDNGFREGKKDWMIGWANSALRSNVYQSLTRWQKVNHFPRSHEITKKDSLFKNFSRMQSLHGKKHYDFVPETYVLPGDLNELAEIIEKDPSQLWIVKPSGSSQGKGIFLTNKVQEIPPGQPMVASRYIMNPLLINQLKFDMRIYVAVTSVDPLRIYIYEEGLVRFATSSYDLNNPENRFGHLTNYSLNKFAPNFQDLQEDGKGYKWTISALKEFLLKYKVDWDKIWNSIKDIVIKTMISIESTMTAGVNMFVPYRNNCFELLGFDILLDDSLRAWLIEVNLSPSLNIDTSIDFKVKCPMLSELLTIIGVPCMKYQKKRKEVPGSRPAWSNSFQPLNQELTKNEVRVIQEAMREISRSEKFECIFPSRNSYTYKQFFDTERPLNALMMAHFSSGSKREMHLNQLHSYEAKIEKMRNKHHRLKKEEMRYNLTPSRFLGTKSNVKELAKLIN